MESSTQPIVSSPLRKLLPKVKLPVASVLRGLLPEDFRILQRRLAEPAECVMDPAFQEPAAQAIYGGLLSAVPVRPRAVPASDDSGVDQVVLPFNRR